MTDIQCVLIMVIILLAYLLAGDDQATVWSYYVEYRIKLWFLNERLRYASWKKHKEFEEWCKQEGFPPPGPFQFVNIWDRDNRSHAKLIKQPNHRRTMAFYTKTTKTSSGVKKRTSIGNGLRKRGSYKRKSQKPSRGQGK